MNAYMNRNAQNVMMIVYAIIGLCVVCFFMVDLKSELGAELMLSGLGIREGYYYQLVTCGFLHADIGHILFNMWGLYIFSTMLANVLKPYQFLILYFLSMVVGSLLYIAFNDPRMPCLGASGAVCGVSMAAAMLNPNVRIMLMFVPRPIKMKTFALVYIGISILLGVLGGGNIAHLAHLGGFIGGYLYLRIARLYAWDPLAFIFKSKPHIEEFNSYDCNSNSKDDVEDIASPKNIERLIRKVSEDGINSLTAEEYDVLQKFRNSYAKK